MNLQTFNQLFIGFSGGLDSTVLLHSLASEPSLHAKLIAVHVNHGISPNAIKWQKHCEQYCEKLQIKFICKTVAINLSANIEERARIARYTVFESLLGENDCLLLGHHQDDQAETVLLNLFRGAGIDGLAAMSEISQFANTMLVRPLLNKSRKELEQYALLHQLHWINDESNQDINFSRNFLRNEIMPLLTDKWPQLAVNLARASKHCQQAKSNLNTLAFNDCPQLKERKEVLYIQSLLNLNEERLANVLRVWLQLNQVKAASTVNFTRIINELIKAKPDAKPKVSWGDIIIRRYQNSLFLQQKDIITMELPLAEELAKDLFIPQGAKLSVKFRQGGETIFLNGQTKKLKKLFQEWQIPPWERERVPLLYVNEELAAVVGYAVCDRYSGKSYS